MKRIAIIVLLAVSCVARSLDAEDRPMKVFILAGQSNMVGWGDSLKLTEEWRDGNDRVLMFEQGKWQTLKPFAKAQKQSHDE